MDREQIENIISSKHEKFLSAVGSAYQNVSADHHLLLNEVSSKIRFIADILSETGVINLYDVKVGRGSHTFNLVRQDLEPDVRVFTNGRCIIFVSGVDHDPWGGDPSKMVIEPDKEKGYNWDDITEELVDFIHEHMYSSSESFEVNFSLMLEEERMK